VHTFYEFFAGGGMARAGLGAGWRCLFANDFDSMKANAYFQNWNDKPTCVDIAAVNAKALPGCADLAWASFPCQDLSLAGDYRGLGSRDDLTQTRSGAFWAFWELMLQLKDRRPRTIVLENVYGAITSNEGRDFAAIASTLATTGYYFGAVVIDARHFVPQSRPRLFIFAVRDDLFVPPKLVSKKLSEKWHPQALRTAHTAMSQYARSYWVWWRLPSPKRRSKTFADIIETEPTGVDWDSHHATERLLNMMTPINLKKVQEAKAKNRPIIGGVYKRTRIYEGKKMQCAEVRFDDISGCLRTPTGGSSRQRILVINGQSVRSRLLSPREAARLMGLSDKYKLPPRYNDAYHLAGDGVVVPVVRHLAKHLIEPLLQSQRMAQAAE
jgi:DNA (cytosine-5)-methyltransferase 1